MRHTAKHLIPLIKTIIIIIIITGLEAWDMDKSHRGIQDTTRMRDGETKHPFLVVATERVRENDIIC